MLLVWSQAIANLFRPQECVRFSITTGFIHERNH